MARSIVITSGKGGVGKSTITAYLGRNLAKIGKKVVLIDADLGLKNLDVIMHLENRVIYDIEDVIKGRTSLSKALIEDKEYPSLYLLPASLKTNILNFSFEHFQIILNELNKDFDYILIDSPAGIEKGFFNAIKGASEALVITTLDKSSIKDADKVIGILKSEQFINIKLIINKVNRKNLKNELDINIDDALRVLGIPLLGILYEEPNIRRSQNYTQKLRLINEDNFLSLVLKISGEKYEVSKSNFIQKILKKVKIS